MSFHPCWLVGICLGGTLLCSTSNGGWGKYGVVVVLSGDSSFLLATCGGLVGIFSVKSFKSFFQEYPRYFEGIPLSYEEFVFDIPCYTARDMAESKMVDLLKSEGVEYS